MKLPWWMENAELRMTSTDSGGSCYGYYEPAIGTWLHKVTHRDGTVEVFHGPIGRERKVATIRPKRVTP